MDWFQVKSKIDNLSDMYDRLVEKQDWGRAKICREEINKWERKLKKVLKGGEKNAS